jgi:adenylylsulfate kinase
MMGTVLWITGLPGSGKSTIADAVKRLMPHIVVLRMDEMRKIVTPQPAYSDEEREIVYRAMVFCARTLASLGHDVIIDATGNRRKWRILARNLVPSFAEIYLKCPLEKCREREQQRQHRHGAPKAVYQKGDAGRPVPGVNVPYEEPLNPEVSIDTSSVSAGESAAIVLDFLQKRLLPLSAAPL